MYIRKLAAAAGFACGAALAFAPLASADNAGDAGSLIDTLISGAAPAAATPINIDISFDGYTIYDGGGTALAETGAAGNGNYDLAIAYGANSTAIAEGGYGDNALASGTYALAEAGSTTAKATGFNFDSATDIGNNAAPSTYTGAPDGAYAGGGSLTGGVDSGVSANDTAQFLGSAGGGGTSGAFAGDSAMLPTEGATAGSGDTAYTSGTLSGAGDGSAAVGGTGDSAYTTGSETGSGEGAFAAFGNYDSATADTNYTVDGDGATATYGNYNYAFADGPANSQAIAGGDSATDLSNSNIAYVADPFGSAADTATAGGGATTGGSDLAEVLFSHGDATAVGNLLYDIVSLFGNFSGSL